MKDLGKQVALLRKQLMEADPQQQMTLQSQGGKVPQLIREQQVLYAHLQWLQAQQRLSAGGQEWQLAMQQTKQLLMENHKLLFLELHSAKAAQLQLPQKDEQQENPTTKQSQQDMDTISHQLAELKAMLQQTQQLLEKQKGKWWHGKNAINTWIGFFSFSALVVKVIELIFEEYIQKTALSIKAVLQELLNHAALLWQALSALV